MYSISKFLVKITLEESHGSDYSFTWAGVSMDMQQRSATKIDIQLQINAKQEANKKKQKDKSQTLIDRIVDNDYGNRANNFKSNNNNRFNRNNNSNNRMNRNNSRSMVSCNYIKLNAQNDPERHGYQMYHKIL